MENPASDGYSDPAARTGRREVTAKDREILFGREPISALKVVALIASTQRGAEPEPDAWEAGGLAAQPESPSIDQFTEGRASRTLRSARR